jgi:hypothetical protein
MTSSNESCSCRKDTLPSSPASSAGNTTSRSRWKPLQYHYCIDRGELILCKQIKTNRQICEWPLTDNPTAYANANVNLSNNIESVFAALQGRQTDVYLLLWVGLSLKTVPASHRFVASRNIYSCVESEQWMICKQPCRHQARRIP